MVLEVFLGFSWLWVLVFGFFSPVPFQLQHQSQPVPTLRTVWGVQGESWLGWFVSKSIQGEKPRQLNCAGVLEKDSIQMFPSKTYKVEVGRAQQTGVIWLGRLPVID